MITENNKSIYLEPGLFIGNQFVPSIKKKKLPAINPATGKIICEVYEGDKEDVEKAVESAKKGFHLWSKMSTT